MREGDFLKKVPLDPSKTSRRIEMVSTVWVFKWDKNN